MKFNVVLISVLLLIFSISAVSAVGITDYNAPIGFDRGAVTFTHDDFEMDMKWYSSFVDHDDYFKNSDDYKVKINGTYAEYSKEMMEKVGALELIEIDGDQYIVDCSFDDMDKSKTKDCQKYLEEFNEVNKFKPVKIE